ncbi:MAG: efflux RND transporter periplasmic adaptor subunit [Rickettsiales bacterium]|jgi:HlyD family secretion protein|nr:efflux RND transporter periplasmic adaptor subunit [Rickettsiales bacterium]
MKKKYIVSFLLILLVVGYFVLKPTKVRFNLEDFDIETVTRGDILKIITANGTIKPVSVVNVGTQVSGTVEKIFVDFNSKVKKNQLLAKIDTSVLERNLNEVEEARRKARSTYALVESNYKKTLNLYKQNFIAKVELEEAETQLKNAKSDYNIANSRYETAKINLGYASITSPVAGVVISRDVDAGQTVAASYSTPTLFKIAEDLTKMQIETSVSEADIGNVTVGLDIEFSVDAFPGDKFFGKIQQVRLNSVTESNVVVYNVIISIKNDDLKLMPGMTAYVNIPVGEVKDVLKVNSVALRFIPNDVILEIFGMEEQPRRQGSVVVYKINTDTKKVTPVYIKRGMSNLSHTEIVTEDLRDGDKIISNSTLVVNGRH